MKHALRFIVLTALVLHLHSYGYSQSIKGVSIGDCNADLPFMTTVGGIVGVVDGYEVDSCTYQLSFKAQTLPDQEQIDLFIEGVERNYDVKFKYEIKNKDTWGLKAKNKSTVFFILYRSPVYERGENGLLSVESYNDDFQFIIVDRELYRRYQRYVKDENLRMASMKEDSVYKERERILNDF